MNTDQLASDRARWEVIISGKAKTVRKKFGADLAGAVALYGKAVGKFGTKRVTLRCCNIAIPPPPELQPHEKLVRVKGKKKPMAVLVRPLNALNKSKGIWWCPYCMKLRRFVERRGLRKEDGSGWEYENAYKFHRCPVCHISHKDGGVRRWNPIATRILMGEKE